MDSAIECMDGAMQPDLSVNGSVRIASLRYYNPRGVFAAALSALGIVVPEPLRCVAVRPPTAAAGLFAWRSPTETVWICDSPSRFEEIKSALEEADDGYLVDQTGGRRLLELRGPRSGELLSHVGSGFAEMAVGASKSGRMADIAVLACRPSVEEWLLVVDRLYLEHLLGFLPPWISRNTTAIG
jgi:sarcosine oxidase gamma subunit